MPTMKVAQFVKTEKLPEEQFGRQASLVWAALEAKPEGSTLDEVTSFIVENGLVTRQDPSRIAMYYLAIFKKRGFIVAQDVPAPTPVVADEPVTDDASDDSEVTLETEEIVTE
jgi:hypothetical protein